MSEPDRVSDAPHVVGWLCPSMPDGPLIPVGQLCDPCGGDVPVWSDGIVGWREGAA